MNFDYVVPLTFTPEDNQTEITTTTVYFKDCSLFPSSGDDFWNCNRCPNDDDYCQPYISGDLIYFQLPVNQNIYCDTPYSQNQYNIVVNGVSHVISTAQGLTIQSDLGVEDRTDYINVILDTSNDFFSDKQCWYFQIGLLNCQTGDIDYFNTEFYCIVRCEEDTILIEGDYGFGTDCNGNYYGGFMLGAGIYKLSFRVRGSVESTGFEFEETVNNNIKIKSKQREQFTLFTHKIPYYVVKQLAAAFNSKQLTIDGINYSGAIKLGKNFDEGNMWIIKENIYKDCDEINFTCE